MRALVIMATVTKFDISKFDGMMSFNIWKVQMMVSYLEWVKEGYCRKKRRNLLP